ncbi:helix-turn-helix domain-containing protein [Sphingobacterium cellulitidis]|uniref:helix-turn-helix domain-containing protein n=1 Tax=Sphingobacterium cellulitidis TaxID=1768011 RepID=UPI000B941F64|nr:hypothetical protein CHT99_01110 [Sphingobacterium cellulitidis]
MHIDIVTKEDLCKMQKEMMEEIRQLVKENVKRENDRQWFRSAEVRKMLGISQGTLQNLPVNGTLPYKKIGESIYYHGDDIQKMMEGRHGMDRNMGMPGHLFTTYFEKVTGDDRMLPSHIGLVIALFYYHDTVSSFDFFPARRSRLMRFSRIRSLVLCIQSLKNYAGQT